MSFSISKYARGLPSILDLKERGLGPRSLNEEIQGIVDVGPLYLLQGRVTETTAFNAALGLGFIQFTTPYVVPAGELWYVWEYSLGTTLAAGEAITCCPAIRYDGVAAVPLAVSRAGVANTQMYIPATKPFWATPGSQFGLLVESFTLAPATAASALVTKLRI